MGFGQPPSPVLPLKPHRLKPVLLGLLLRHAVYRTEAENEIEACNADYLAVGEIGLWPA